MTICPNVSLTADCTVVKSKRVFTLISLHELVLSAFDEIFSLPNQKDYFKNAMGYLMWIHNHIQSIDLFQSLIPYPHKVTSYNVMPTSFYPSECMFSHLSLLKPNLVSIFFYPPSQEQFYSITLPTKFVPRTSSAKS
jgi:hypothetical protein